MRPGVGALPLRGALWAAFAWGSLAALGQCAKLFRRYYINGEFAWSSRDVFWMSPLANTVYFGLVGALLWLAGRAWRGKGSDPLIGGVLAGLCAFSVLIPFGGLNEYAVLALAVGAGVQYGRMLRGGAPRLRRWVQVAGVMAAVLLLTGGLVERATRGYRNTPSVNGIPADDAPNVLVIIWDTVRAKNLSLYGYPRETTPQLTRLAESAMTFDWAISPSPWTLPSHCSMFTGLHHGEHRCRWDDPLGAVPMTLAQAFARNGYRTGAFVANRFYASHETGLGRGFSVYEDFQVTLQQILLSSSLSQLAIPRELMDGVGFREKTEALRTFGLRGPPKPTAHRKVAATVTDEFLEWEGDGEAQPFFAFLNYFDAHDPYEPPEPWRTRFSPTPDRMALYDGGIAYMDAELGRLTGELAKRGVLDRTVIVVTSDHGEMFGEHGGVLSHGHALYLELTHVPLVVRYPRALPAGVRVSRPAPLRDLARSLVELAGLKDTMPGHNLLTEAWRSTPVPVQPSRDRLALSETERTKMSWTKGPAADGALHALLDDTYHYILYPGDREDLFAYRRDAAEANNLATTHEGAALAAQYRALLPLATRRLVK